jgi:hypothetical protein
VAAVNLLPGSGGLTTQLNEGGLMLGPAPSDAAGDPLDGQVLIRARGRGRSHR